MKATYIIKETQNINSDRQGETFEGTLTAAKRHATRNQFFCGTVLKIETQNGSLICFKEDAGTWQQA